MKTWLARAWCWLFHYREWTLYGGFRNPFVYCNLCGDTWGDEASWTRGVEYGVAPHALQTAADDLSLLDVTKSPWWAFWR